MASLPFKQHSLSASRLLREFSRDAPSDELVWHRDREARTVRALEGRGWALQLDGGLPQPIRLGEAHHIPAGTWHRLLRRPDATTLRLVVELKKGDRVKHDGKEATVKVPDARGDLVGLDPAGPDDMEMVPEDELEPLREKDGGGKGANRDGGAAHSRYNNCSPPAVTAPSRWRGATHTQAKHAPTHTANSTRSKHYTQHRADN